MNCDKHGEQERAANGQCRICKNAGERARRAAALSEAMGERPRILPLSEVMEGAKRAAARVEKWPQWKKDLSPLTSGGAPASLRGRKHAYIPDLQAKPGVPLNHLYWIAYYLLDKQPDVVVLAGDVYDLPSLSSYDKRGSKSSEGRRVSADMDAGDRALDVLASVWDKAGFFPEKHVTLGNHENRLARAVDADPHLLDGVVRDFAFKRLGWTEHEFLKPVSIDGIRYCHFFPQSASGAVCQTKRGAPSAREQVRRQMCSSTAGHQQGLDVAVYPTPDGLQRGLIAGSCYLHDEDYMGPLNNYWRGIVLKHNVRAGNYNLCEVDLGYLASKYARFEPAGKKVA